MRARRRLKCGLIARRDRPPDHPRRRRALPDPVGPGAARPLQQSTRPWRRREGRVGDRDARVPVHRPARLHDASPDRRDDLAERAPLVSR